MGTYPLGLYLKLNLLLAAAYLLWLLTKTFMRMLRIDVSHARQLVIARYLFGSLLLAIPVILFINLITPGWLAGFAAALQKQWLVSDITVIAGLDNQLEQQYSVGNAALALITLIYVVLLAGFALQLGRLITRVARLRRIIDGAVEWKCIREIRVLFSSDINSPFSTRALGKNHIVLPYQLLDSPRNLRLAVKHELQHLRNGDLEWVILLEAIKTLCFWNPAIYLWHNEFDCLQEFACDEVLIHDHQVNSQAYGSCLLEVASGSTGSALVAASNMVPKFSLLENQHSQLKRRIIMLTTNRNKKLAGLKSFGYGLFVSFGLLNTAIVVFAADNGPQIPDAQAWDFRPIVRINPEYPAQALAEKLVGWVELDFTISETGRVLDAFVVENCVRPGSAPEDSCAPNDIFDTSSVAALTRWTFAPRMENGVAVEVEDVRTVLRFQLEE
jgi:TonB family protein